jgi:hypothetical protein
MMIRQLRRCFAVLLLGAVALIAGQARAQATEDYSFHVDWNNGFLADPAPTTTDGSFSFLASLAVANATVEATGLLTTLNVTVNGIPYDVTNATGAKLVFDSSGVLALAVLGTNCSLGACTTNPGQDQWFVNAAPGSLVANGAAATASGQEVPSFGGVTSTCLNCDGGVIPSPNSTPVPAVPEPSTYALMLAGLAAVGFIARRRRRS